MSSSFCKNRKYYRSSTKKLCFRALIREETTALSEAKLPNAHSVSNTIWDGGKLILTA